MQYDEFGYFHENASEFGLSLDRPPSVRRVDVTLPDGRHLSGLRWGDAAPELVLVHGGAQNAHTWDTVALALDRPLLAVDLPGHGHSAWRDDHAYSVPAAADDVAHALAAHDLASIPVVGMSLGGLTSIALADRHPAVVDRLMLVDVTPGVDREKSSAIVDFVNGPQSFASFDELLARTIEHNPTRTESSLRRGILHNAHQLPDGTWQWRYDRLHLESAPPGVVPDWTGLWEALGRHERPLWLARGALSPVVADDDVEELRRRAPHARVVVFEGAGHSIQGDRPLELAALIDEFLGR